MRTPLVLLILDGWGVAQPNRGNAIARAATPVFDRLVTTYPTMLLQASGEAVGLPWGEMGNSEVGHLNIGAGRIVYQNLPRITRAISDGSFFTNAAFLQAIAHAAKHHSAVHCAGMVSSGGVHSVQEHLSALLDLCVQQHVQDVRLHVFLDGRDTPYNSAVHFLKKLQQEIARRGAGRIVSLTGRYFAMDRDRHWDRTARAYHAMTDGADCPRAADAVNAVEQAYAKCVYDEEFPPTVMDSAGSRDNGVHDNDALIFFNFRNDRMRQLTRAFVARDAQFPRPKQLANLFVVTMTEYEAGLPVTIAFPPEYIETPLAKVVSDAGLQQLHVAETEKYAHVTFFLNGGREAAFPGEERELVPSPAVATYDQQPAMNAAGVTDALTAALAAGKYDFLVANYANADMVGHTGNLPAIIQAVETLDACVGRVLEAALAAGGIVAITADHGNAEEAMHLQTGTIDKEHSTSPVPFIIVGNDWKGQGAAAGRDLSMLTPTGMLADIAPTLLALMGIPKPSSMTGRNVLTMPGARTTVP